jgi:hypothetical protein
MQSVQDPTVTTWRSKRGLEVQPEDGQHYKDNLLKRFVEGRNFEIIPSPLRGNKKEGSTQHA